MRLRPFFSYYGAKHRIAPRYPPPVTRQIVDAFAGSAAYPCCYPHLKVLLCDANPRVCGAWDYLIRAPESEIARLRLLGPDEGPDDLGAVPQEAKWLVGFNIAIADAEPAKRPRAWWKKYHRDGGDPEFSARYEGKFWSERRRARIVSQLRWIRHWRVCEGTYAALPNWRADWFVDPPYSNGAGNFYTFGAAGIDYSDLASWCRNRRGQAIVCENVGATWLPFAPFRDTPGAQGKNRSGISREAIWHRSDEPPLQGDLLSTLAA